MFFEDEDERDENKNGVRKKVAKSVFFFFFPCLVCSVPFSFFTFGETKAGILLWQAKNEVQSIDVYFWCKQKQFTGEQRTDELIDQIDWIVNCELWGFLIRFHLYFWR